jgi:hypothetical protein
VTRPSAWLALFACACAGGPNYPDGPTAVVDVPTPADSSEPMTPRDAGSDAPLEVGLSAPFDVLGRACAENERDRPSHLMCDTRGKVSGVTAEPTPMTEALPLPDARTVYKTVDSGPSPGRVLEVGIAGQLVAIRFVICPNCPAPTGFTFVGDLSRLTDGDLAALQQRIGLPAGTLPLRTHDDWKRALQRDAG